MSGSSCADDVGTSYTIRFAEGKLRAGYGSTDAEILRCAQDDSQDTAQSPLMGSLISLRPTYQARSCSSVGQSFTPLFMTLLMTISWRFLVILVPERTRCVSLAVAQTLPGGPLT